LKKEVQKRLKKEEELRLEEEKREREELRLEDEELQRFLNNVLQLIYVKIITNNA